MKSTAFVVVSLAALYRALGAFAATLSTDPYTITGTLQSVLNAAQGNESLVTYPTDLTRNLVPVRHFQAY